MDGSSLTRSPRGAAGWGAERDGGGGGGGGGSLGAEDSVLGLWSEILDSTRGHSMLPGQGLAWLGRQPTMSPWGYRGLLWPSCRQPREAESSAGDAVVY